MINDVEQSLSFLVPNIFNLEEGELFYFYVRDRNGEAYTFPCSIQPNRELGLVVSINSLDFARIKGIRPEVEVVLLGEFVGGKDRRMQLTILLQRKIILLGKDIWGILL
ncbi:hypothetical protein REPUB_Repub04eG0065600 [Reevesia pubescens]